MKDRHILLILALSAFLGAMFFVGDLASNSAIAGNRNTRNIPADLSEELGLADSSNRFVETADSVNPLNLTIEQTELERLDTLLEKMSEISPLIDEVEKSRVLIDAVHVK